jgi:hypothetical protein
VNDAIQIRMADLHRTKPGKDDGVYDVWVFFTESDGYQWVLRKTMHYSSTEPDRPELLHSEVTELAAFLASDPHPTVKRNLQRALKQISK